MIQSHYLSQIVYLLKKKPLHNTKTQVENITFTHKSLCICVERNQQISGLFELDE